MSEQRDSEAVWLRLDVVLVLRMAQAFRRRRKCCQGTCP